MKKLFLYLTILILSAIVQNNKLLAAEQAGPEQAAAKAAGVPAKAGAASQAAAGGPMVVGAVSGGAGAGGAAGLAPAAGAGPAVGAAKVEGKIEKKHTREQIAAATKRLFAILAPRPLLNIYYEREDVDAIKALIENGADVNAIFDEPENDLYPSDTPLMIALHRPSVPYDLEIVKLLLKHGANANFQNPKTGDTPLMAAVNTFSPEKVKLLLEFGADLHPLIKNNKGETFLDLTNRPYPMTVPSWGLKYGNFTRGANGKTIFDVVEEFEEFKKKRTDAIRAADSLSVYPRPVADIIGEYAGHPEND